MASFPTTSNISFSDAAEVSVSENLRTWDSSETKKIDMQSLQEYTVDLIDKLTKTLEQVKETNSEMKKTLKEMKKFSRNMTAKNQAGSPANAEEDSFSSEDDDSKTDNKASPVQKTEVDPPKPVAKEIAKEVAKEVVKEISKKEKLNKSSQRPRKLRKTRSLLPANQCAAEPIGFRSIVAMAIHKGGIPVCMYEPTGLLQLLCEELKWSYLLDNAAACNSPDERLSWIVAYAISVYSSTIGRYRKPFNPVIGETFDYIDNERGWKFHGEQVSHHPCITAAQAQGKNWLWWQNLTAEVITSKLNMISELTPGMPVRVRIGSEDICWTRPKTTIEKINAIPEKRNIYHEGSMQFRSSSGCSARLVVNRTRECAGEVFDRNGRQCFKLFGGWDVGLSRSKPGGENRESLFELKGHDYNPAQYGFTKFTMSLNELYEEDRPSLPPTDCRFRPDMRALESGKIELTAQYKDALERLQRARERANTYTPLWFTPETDSFIGKGFFVSNGKYWDAKTRRYSEQHERNLFPAVFAIQK
ncbi:unnamed protein product [Caenorhabditis auriculariae]|uniref:Oxysterol-binding protein n=1 Tax=Caenorhabditis auriculariae TaxID=2777116 RepID=A0A8S1H9E1_9PELO|nr:unnamed protein product [Caenorhabditis auriculariae]